MDMHVVLSPKGMNI